MLVGMCSAGFFVILAPMCGIAPVDELVCPASKISGVVLVIWLCVFVAWNREWLFPCLKMYCVASGKLFSGEMSLFEEKEEEKDQVKRLKAVVKEQRRMMEAMKL